MAREKRVENKVAFVTGGGSGIGEAACRALAREGAAVADYRLEPAEAVAQSIRDAGGKTLAVEMDVREEEAVHEAVKKTVEEFGSLNIVFANAGINGMQCPIEEMTMEEWRATLDTNLTGTFLTIKHSIPHLRAADGGYAGLTLLRG